jgi:hypothetical protein
MNSLLPTSTLIKSSLIAFFVAVLALFFIILPAEYNIDPSGIGERLGLTALAQPQPIIEKDSSIGFSEQSDSFEIIVPAKRGIEFKFSMEQFTKMQYEWETDGEALYFDLHGEPKGNSTDYFESYVIATLDQMQGSYTVPFAGSHGWYWRNDSNKAVIVKLKVSGQYNIIGLKQ